jgi:hypothetical protein
MLKSRCNLNLNLSALLKYTFFFIKTNILLYIEFSNNINCDAFSVAPSIIDENVLFYHKGKKY